MPIYSMQYIMYIFLWYEYYGWWNSMLSWSPGGAGSNTSLLSFDPLAIWLVVSSLNKKDFQLLRFFEAFYLKGIGASKKKSPASALEVGPPVALSLSVALSDAWGKLQPNRRNPSNSYCFLVKIDHNRSKLNVPKAWLVFLISSCFKDVQLII